jgi:NitT/TauT family transport system permease protein
MRRWAMLAFATLIAIWCAVTYSGLVPPLFLPTPDRVLWSLYGLFAEDGFAYDVGVSSGRLSLGFLFSCAAAVPLGVWVGTSRRGDSLCTPLLNFIRYMPAPAFIPLLILWIGIGLWQKVALVFISIFFYLASLVAESVRNVSQDSIDTALTLGASRRQVLTRVVLRAAYPGIWQSMRIMMGVAWTSIVIVELVAAQHGVGAMIIRAQRFLQTPKIIAGIVVIGVLGVLFDGLFRMGYRLLFPWAAQEKQTDGR